MFSQLISFRRDSLVSSFQLRRSHFSYFLFVSSNHPISVLILPMGNSSPVTPALLAYLPLSVSICLSAGVTREMEQCEKAGGVGQTAGGTTAGHRGGQSAQKVCFVRCRAAHLQGTLPQQRALQVERLLPSHN